MLYSFMELPDQTVISHYDMADGKVKVYMETPDEKNGFNHATCWLPEGKWVDVSGYSESRLAYLKELIESEKHMILELAQTGGLMNAANI